MYNECKQYGRYCFIESMTSFPFSIFKYAEKPDSALRLLEFKNTFICSVVLV